MGGLVLLAVLSVGVLLLYRGAPQSVAEAGARSWMSVRPDAFTPRFVRAEQSYVRAAELRAAGRDSAAAAGFADAAAGAWEARGRAGAEEQRARASELWATALLERGDILLGAGSTAWWRPDDNAVLEDALASVDAVLGVRTSPEIRRRADTLAAALRAKLRPGPLEWFPGRR